MTQDQLTQFQQAALTGGAILFGFIGTFLSFRIQREANYYRQPVLDFNKSEKEPLARDVHVNLSHFTSSLALIALAALISMIFGVLGPLAALAQWRIPVSSPEWILSGIVSSLVLVVFYFLDELYHYGIIGRLDGDGWKKEWWIVLAGIGFAVTCAWVSFHALIPSSPLLPQIPHA